MNFFYEATDTTGQTVMGRLDAGSETEVRQRLQQMGYRPQAIALNGVAAPQQQALANAPAAVAPPNSPISGGTRSQLLAGAPVHHATAVMPAGMATRAPSVQSAVSQTGARSGGIILSGNAAKTTSAVSQTAGTSPLGRTSAPVANVSQLGGVNDRDRLFFFQQLTSLVKSGMSIYLALDNLGPRTKNVNLSKAACDMAEGARTGGRVSDVMERYPRIFEEHITGLIRAGELGGFLPEALAEIAHNYEQNLALYKGSWIPKMMAIQGIYGLVLAIPLFPDVIGHATIETGVRDGLRLYAFHEAFLLPLAILLIQGAKWGWSHLQLPGMRRFRDSLSLKLPPYGDLHRQAALSSFVRMLRRLYHAGINPAAAWEGAMFTASNVVIRERLAASYEMMQRGVGLAEAFAATGLFNGNMEQILTTGHLSGQVVESLDQIADFYHERVDEAQEKSRRAIAWAGRMAMIVLAGITVVWLTKSCYDAQFKFIDNNFDH